jgi:hypothetical protein
MNDAGYANPDINTHKQDRHLKGTIDHQIAVNNGQNPSTFPDREAAEKYVSDVWNTGLPDRDNPNKKTKTYRNPVGQNSKGNDLYQVTVHGSRTGMHGWPSGKGTPGRYSNPQ